MRRRNPFTMSRRLSLRNRPPSAIRDARLFKECDATTVDRRNAAPHSCRRRDDNDFFDWRTLEQTCSRGDPGSAICVQRLDDSLNSAIHTRYRSLLRSSSMHEPRDPPSEVVKVFQPTHHNQNTTQSLINGQTKNQRWRSPFEARRAASDRFPPIRVPHPTECRRHTSNEPNGLSPLRLPVHGVLPSPREGDDG